jgi:hypothetical protein
MVEVDDEPLEPHADTYDQYVGASVSLPIGNELVSAKVCRRKRMLDGSVTGKANKNPILDTRTYEVEFPDGQIAEFSANVIAQNMYEMCGTEGNQYLLLSGIIGHRKEESALNCDDMYVKPGSNQQLKRTTKGWKLCVEWKDGSTSWERLADLKESNPVELEEYAVADGIDT